MILSPHQWWNEFRWIYSLKLIQFLYTEYCILSGKMHQKHCYFHQNIHSTEGEYDFPHTHIVIHYSNLINLVRVVFIVVLVFRNNEWIASNGRMRFTIFEWCKWIRFIFLFYIRNWVFVKSSITFARLMSLLTSNYRRNYSIKRNLSVLSVTIFAKLTPTMYFKWCHRPILKYQHNFEIF